MAQGELLSLEFQIVKPETSVEVSLRFKNVLHPDESLDAFYARILAFIFTYQVDLEFSSGLYTPTEPAIFKHNQLGHLETWVGVGQYCFKNLVLTKRRNNKTKFIYFSYQEDQNLIQHLSSQELALLADVDFYKIDQDALAVLVAQDRVLLNYQATVFENQIYLESNKISLAVNMQPFSLQQENSNNSGNASY